MQYLVGIRENLGYLDGEDGAVVDDGVGSLARADLEADGGGEEVGRLLEHLRELPPVGGEELPVGDSLPGRGAREREQDRRDAAVAALARRGARAGRLARYSLDRVVVRRRGRPPPRRRSRRAERRLPGGGGLAAEKLRHSHFPRFWFCVYVVVGFGWRDWQFNCRLCISYCSTTIQTSGGPLVPFRFSFIHS